jgi:hypothetical protein
LHGNLCVTAMHLQTIVFEAVATAVASIENKHYNLDRAKITAKNYKVAALFKSRQSISMETEILTESWT